MKLVVVACSTRSSSPCMFRKGQHSQPSATNCVPARQPHPGGRGGSRREGGGGRGLGGLPSLWPGPWGKDRDMRVTAPARGRGREGGQGMALLG